MLDSKHLEVLYSLKSCQSLRLGFKERFLVDSSGRAIKTSRFPSNVKPIVNLKQVIQPKDRAWTAKNCSVPGLSPGSPSLPCSDLPTSTYASTRPPGHLGVDLHPLLLFPPSPGHPLLRLVNTEPMGATTKICPGPPSPVFPIFRPQPLLAKRNPPFIYQSQSPHPIPLRELPCPLAKERRGSNQAISRCY